MARRASSGLEWRPPHHRRPTARRMTARSQACPHLTGHHRLSTSDDYEPCSPVRADRSAAGVASARWPWQQRTQVALAYGAPAATTATPAIAIADATTARSTGLDRGRQMRCASSA
eukprot:2499756-Pleurochrysis_carterae.AAC.2